MAFSHCQQNPSSGARSPRGAQLRGETWGSTLKQILRYLLQRWGGVRERGVHLCCVRPHACVRAEHLPFIPERKAVYQRTALIPLMWLSGGGLQKQQHMDQNLNIYQTPQLKALGQRPPPSPSVPEDKQQADKGAERGSRTRESHVHPISIKIAS